MKYSLIKSNHSVFAMHYHFVQCVKNRKKVLVNENIVDLLKQKVHEISYSYGIEVLNIEADKDYFHMIFTGTPTVELSKYINTIKTITSREIRRNYPEVKTKLKDEFWSPSYFLATTGQVTLDVLKKYVDEQGE